MTKIKCTISGVSPLLMNRFTEKSEISVSSGIKSSINSHGVSPRDQATPKLYADDKGFLYVPGANIFAAIIAAGVYHKLGKSKLTTMKTSLIPAGMWVTDLICSLGTKDWEVDSRSVVIPSTGGRIMCHRPRLDEWTVAFNIEIDPDMFNEKTARLLIDDAGKKIGLGDYRPSRKGPFGRFVVTKWAVN